MTSQTNDWLAAVDIGTVSVKMLLTDGITRVRHSVDTILGGSALTPNGEVRSEPFSPASLARLEQALAEFRDLVGQHRPSRLRAVTTAPGRWAADLGALAALVDRYLEVDLDVLAGHDEAALAWQGAAAGEPGLSIAGAPPPGSRVVTIDVGGGSTELAAGTAGSAAPDQVFSMPIGGRTVTVAYLESDPPRPEELSAALSVIELHVDDVRREVPALVDGLDSALVLGLGAVTTIAAIECGLNEGDPNRGDGDGPLHGFELQREAVEDVFRTIATEARADRLFNPGLPPTRVDEIVGATAVLVETMRQLDLERVVVSQRGLLDGLVAGLRIGSSGPETAPLA